LQPLEQLHLVSWRISSGADEFEENTGSYWPSSIIQPLSDGSPTVGKWLEKGLKLEFLRRSTTSEEIDLHLYKANLVFN
jgi:hypothetical protein